MDLLRQTSAAVLELTLSSPLAERASHEWSSSADRPPALLASSPDPSRICAPPGSAPPAEKSENTVNTQVLALKMAKGF